MKRTLIPLVSITALIVGCSASDSSTENSDEITQALNCSAPANPTEVNRCNVRNTVMSTSGLGPDNLMSAPSYTNDFKCTYEHSSTVSNYGQELLGRPGQIGLFPGAIHSHLAPSTRDLNGPKLSDRTMPAKVEISGVALKPGAATNATATKLTRSEVEFARNNLLQNGDAVFMPAIQHQFYALTKDKDLAIKLKVDINWLKASLGYGSSTSQQEMLLELEQDYYDLTVPKPQPEDMFTDDTTPAHLTGEGLGPNTPFTYVSRVTYGRKLIVRIQSNYSATEVQAAISFMLSELEKQRAAAAAAQSGGGGTGGAGGTGGTGGTGGAGAGGTGGTGGSTSGSGTGGSLEIFYRKVLSEMTVNVLDIGGPTPAISTGTALLEEMKKGIKWSTAGVPRPIRFSLNHFATNDSLGTFFITDFYKANCSTRTQYMQVELDSLYLRDAGDVAGNGEPTWNINWTTQTGTSVAKDYYCPPCDSDRSNGPSRRDDGTTVTLNGNPRSAVVQADLNASPYFNLDAQYDDWNKPVIGKWFHDEHAGAGTRFNYVGNPITGKWTNGTGTKVGVTSSQMLNAAHDHLNVDLYYKIRRNNPCNSNLYNWDGTRCTKVDLALQDLFVPEIAHCGSEHLVVNTSRLYLTRHNVAQLNEQYTLSLVEVDPDTQIENTATKWSQTVTMDAEQGVKPWAFIAKTWAANNGKTLTPGKAYELAYNMENAYGEYLIRMLPINAEFTIDGFAGTEIYRDATAPLSLDATKACGTRQIGNPQALYTLTVARLDGFTVIDSFEKVYQRSELLGYDLRALAQSENWTVLPGDKFRVTLSIDDNGTTRSVTKNLTINGCPSGQAWNGVQCKPVQITQIREVTSSNCVQQSSGSTFSGACTGTAAAFGLIEVSANRVLIQSQANGLCLVSPPLSTGTPLYRRCDGALDQQFDIAESPAGTQIVALGAAAAGNCLRLVTSATFNACSVSNTNFSFDWQLQSPPAPIMPIVRRLSWASQTATNLTKVGTVTETTDTKVGKVFTMAAASSHVSVPDSASVDVGTGDFAMSMWVKTADGAGRVLVDKLDSAGRGYQLVFGQGSLIFKMADLITARDGSTGTTVVGYGALSDNKWHHVTVSVDRDEVDGVGMFIDGRRVATGNPLRHRGSLDNAATLRFGGGTVGSSTTPMSVANVQLFQRSVAQTEVVDLSAGTCTPDIVGHWSGDSSAADSFGGGGTLVGSTTIGGTGKIGGAFTFNGTNGYVNVPDNNLFDFGTGDMSVSFWVKSAAQSSVGVLLDKRVDVPNYQGYHVFLYGSQVGFQLADGVSHQNWTGAGTVADSTWHHVAITLDRDDPAGLRFYSDGVLRSSFDPRSRAGTLSNSAPLRFGARSYESTGSLTAQLDEVKLYARSLTGAEVASLAAADPNAVCR